MLTGKQRSYLKSLAMDISDAVFIGKNEVTENTVNEIDDYLEAHELVKVKILETAQLDPKDIANTMAPILNAEYVQAIGRKFVLYRESKKNKKIVLPK